MNNNLLLILFNIIIIYISLKFKNKIKYYYLIIFILLISYIIYLKSDLIEGNIQDDLFRTFNEFSNTSSKEELPLNKINKVLELMLDSFTGKKKAGVCEGEFVVNKLTDKECGVGFNERVYKITKPGDNCLHSDLYKEKLPLRFCKYNEKCDTDLDCLNSTCLNNICSSELGCDKDMLSSCGYDSCLGLNAGLDKDLYYFQNDKCRVDPCNEKTYQLCNEGKCNDLSYKYKYNTDMNICQKIIEDTDETGMVVGSYLNILQNFQDENSGCTSENPDDCKGLCSDFNPETTERCSIRTTGVGEYEPVYKCLDGYNNFHDTIHSDDTKYPCLYDDIALYNYFAVLKFFEPRLNLPIISAISLPAPAPAPAPSPSPAPPPPPPTYERTDHYSTCEGDILSEPTYIHNLDQAKSHCDSNPSCVGFSQRCNPGERCTFKFYSSISDTAESDQQHDYCYNKNI